MNRMFERLFAFPKPVVAAVNGHAIAGGCIIVCAADWRLMTRDAGRIGIPELLVGVPFPVVPLEIMRFATHAWQLQSLAYRGLTLAAARPCSTASLTASPMGDRLLDEAMAIAESVAALPVRGLCADEGAAARAGAAAHESWRVNRCGRAERVGVCCHAWSDPGLCRPHIQETVGMNPLPKSHLIPNSYIPNPNPESLYPKSCVTPRAGRWWHRHTQPARGHIARRQRDRGRGRRTPQRTSPGRRRRTPNSSRCMKRVAASAPARPVHAHGDRQPLPQNHPRTPARSRPARCGCRSRASSATEIGRDAVDADRGQPSATPANNDSNSMAKRCRASEWSTQAVIGRTSVERKIRIDRVDLLATAAASPDGSPAPRHDIHRARARLRVRQVERDAAARVEPVLLDAPHDANHRLPRDRGPRVARRIRLPIGSRRPELRRHEFVDDDDAGVIR